MLLEEFDYELDPELIAQHPCDRRDQSRMMRVNRATGDFKDGYFYELPGLLKKGDVIVINDSRVVPARLYGRKASGSLLEILLLSDCGEGGWEALLRPGKRVRVGTTILFEDGSEAEVVERLTDKKWRLRFRVAGDFNAFLDCYGRPPLPPYIKRSVQDANRAEDLARYQTVYAKTPGSIAAPTAGLHFSNEILSTLSAVGIRCVTVTLHVGLGTFLPIETETVEDHRMHEEYYEIGVEAAEAINSASRVIAVGTTSTRTIESAADERGIVRPTSAYTGLYIYPGYRFKRVNGMLTNFHLPKSSLFLLVSAFAGQVCVREAYAKAVAERYRFYSYGDCMLIL